MNCFFFRLYNTYPNEQNKQYLFLFEFMSVDYYCYGLLTKMPIWFQNGGLFAVLIFKVSLLLTEL